MLISMLAPHSDFTREKELIVQRLDTALRLGPFSTLLAIITDAHRGAMDADPNASAYKCIAEGLLRALFASSCYAPIALTTHHATIYPLFCVIYQDDSALCYRFWEMETLQRDARPPIMDHAIQR